MELCIPRQSGYLEGFLGPFESPGRERGRWSVRGRRDGDASKGERARQAHPSIGTSRQAGPDSRVAIHTKRAKEPRSSEGARTSGSVAVHMYTRVLLGLPAEVALKVGLWVLMIVMMMVMMMMPDGKGGYTWMGVEGSGIVDAKDRWLFVAMLCLLGLNVFDALKAGTQLTSIGVVVVVTMLRA